MDPYMQDDENPDDYLKRWNKEMKEVMKKNDREFRALERSSRKFKYVGVLIQFFGWFWCVPLLVFIAIHALAGEYVSMITCIVQLWVIVFIYTMMFYVLCDGWNWQYFQELFWEAMSFYKMKILSWLPKSWLRRKSTTTINDFIGKDES